MTKQPTNDEHKRHSSEKSVIMWVCPFCNAQWMEELKNDMPNMCPYCYLNFEVI